MKIIKPYGHYIQSKLAFFKKKKLATLSIISSGSNGVVIASNIGELQTLANDIATELYAVVGSMNKIGSMNDVDSVIQGGLDFDSNSKKCIELLERFNKFELIVSVPFDPESVPAEKVKHYSSKA